MGEEPTQGRTAVKCSVKAWNPDHRSTPGHVLSPVTALAVFLVCAMFIILCQVELVFSY